MIYDLGVDYFVRTLDEQDLEGPYTEWFQDQEVCKYNSHGKVFKTKEYFRAYIRSLDQGDKIVWALCHKKDGHIGNLSLQSISAINRSAEFAIIVGDRRHWGTGAATRAALQLLHHGFLKLNLYRIYCGTAANNVGMQRLALALGMKLEGTRRAHLYLEGEWVDVLEYGVLNSEFPGIVDK